MCSLRCICLRRWDGVGGRETSGHVRDTVMRETERKEDVGGFGG